MRLVSGILFAALAAKMFELSLPQFGAIWSAVSLYCLIRAALDHHDEER